MRSVGMVFNKMSELICIFFVFGVEFGFLGVFFFIIIVVIEYGVL